MNETDKTKEPLAMSNRKHLIRLRLNEAEYALFLQKTIESGLSQSAFMRRMINGASLVQRPCIHHAELLNELSGISNTAQDILNRLIQQESLTETDICALQNVLDRTWQLIASKY